MTLDVARLNVNTVDTVVDHAPVIDSPFPPLPDFLDYTPLFNKLSYSSYSKGLHQEVPDKRALSNPLTGNYIGIVGNRQVVHNFADVYNNFVEKMLLTDLDFTGIKVNFKYNTNYSNFEAWVSLPNISFDEKLGEKATMLIRLRDSHNQSAIRSIQAEIVRGYCLNGCVWKSKTMKELDTSISEMHTKSADPIALSNSASRFPVMLSKQADMLAYTKQVSVSNDEAFDFFKRTLCATVRKGEVKVNEAERERCGERWNKYKHDGNTLWRTYNVLTDFSTHFDVTKDHVVQLEQRRSKVRSALQDPWFQDKMSGYDKEIEDVHTV